MYGTYEKNKKNMKKAVLYTAESRTRHENPKNRKFKN